MEHRFEINPKKTATTLPGISGTKLWNDKLFEKNATGEFISDAGKNDRIGFNTSTLRFPSL